MRATEVIAGDAPKGFSEKTLHTRPTQETQQERPWNDESAQVRVDSKSSTSCLLAGRRDLRRRPDLSSFQMLRAAALLAAVASTSARLLEGERDWSTYTFDAYEADFAKDYESGEERAIRRAIFEENVRVAQATAQQVVVHGRQRVRRHDERRIPCPNAPGARAWKRGRRGRPRGDAGGAARLPHAARGHRPRSTGAQSRRRPSSRDQEVREPALPHACRVTPDHPLCSPPHGPSVRPFASKELRLVLGLLRHRDPRSAAAIASGRTRRCSRRSSSSRARPIPSTAAARAAATARRRARVRLHRDRRPLARRVVPVHGHHRHVRPTRSSRR